MVCVKGVQRVGDRTVPYDKNAICEQCGMKGAFDVMGDLFCHDCASKWVERER